MEMNALAFNPRMHLFSSGTAYDLIVGNGNQNALDELERMLSQIQWGIYHVQRIYKQLIGKNNKLYINADRKVVLIYEGNRTEMESKLKILAQQYKALVENLHGKRFYVHCRQQSVYPAFEEFYVIAPKLAKDKCRNLRAFDRDWAELTGPAKPIQLDLFTQ